MGNTDTNSGAFVVTHRIIPFNLCLGFKKEDRKILSTETSGLMFALVHFSRGKIVLAQGNQRGDVCACVRLKGQSYQDRKTIDLGY